MSNAIGPTNLNLYEIGIINKERIAAIEDFLVHLEEGVTEPLPDTISFMWRQANACSKDMGLLLEAIENFPQNGGKGR